MRNDEDDESFIRVLRELSRALGRFIEAGLVEQRYFVVLYGRQLTSAELEEFVEIVRTRRAAYRDYQRAVTEAEAIVRTQAGRRRNAH